LCLAFGFPAAAAEARHALGTPLIYFLSVIISTRFTFCVIHQARILLAIAHPLQELTFGDLVR
jgi:hypothetical protein